MTPYRVLGTHVQDLPGVGFALPGATVDLDDEAGATYVAAGIVAAEEPPAGRSKTSSGQKGDAS